MTAWHISVANDKDCHPERSPRHPELVSGSQKS